MIYTTCHPQDVSFEDQEQINTFSRLNARLHDLQAKVAAKKRAAEDFEEAGNEVMLLDDEIVPFVVGECMVHLPRDEVEERLEKCELQEVIYVPTAVLHYYLSFIHTFFNNMLSKIFIAVKEEAEEQAQQFQHEVNTVQTEMADLKQVLYAKFGNSINLEE